MLAPPRGVRPDNAQRGAQQPQVAAPQAPRAPARVPATLAPPNAIEAERFNHYANIVRANGGQVNPDGRPTVPGIRGLSTDGTQHPTTFSGGAGGYDDTMVVLTADGHVHEFRGATHPGQRTVSTGGAPNADNDRGGPNGEGTADVGIIRPGNYDVVPNGLHAGSDSFHIRRQEGSDRGQLPGWRDTSHDGRISDAERAASEGCCPGQDSLTEVLFHQGRNRGPVSIGCQTMPPAEHQRFVQAVGGPSARFNYTLVDANAR